MRRPLVAAVLAALIAPASAVAAPPIMALKDVTPGALCTGLTVVQGTTITSFNVRILDVMDAQSLDAARILVRVSGPAVDDTGIGPGFSGSPIYCTGGDGVSRNIGAISESIGEYGGKTVLARPIEAILASPVVPPSSLPTAAHELPIGARSLATPLTIAGLRPAFATALSRAAAKAGRPIIASVANARGTFPKQPLVPGAAVAVGETSGAIAIGAAGTVAYADGGNVWLFGHELDGAGRRSLFLQDAFVHTVVNQPLNLSDVSTYKLASPGNDEGTVTGDGDAAVTGQLGALPAGFPLRVAARDLDTGRTRGLVTQIADEADVGEPTGIPILDLAASTSVVQAVLSVLSGGPARQSGDMCIAVRARELTDKMRVCNTYTVDGDVPNAFTGALIADVGEATRLLSTFRFGVLHLTSVEISVRVRRGVRQAFITGASVRGKARRGKRMTVRLRLRHLRTGRRTTRDIRIRVPRSVRAGRRTLRLFGAPGDVGADPLDDSSLSIIFEDDPGADTDDPGPDSVEGIRDAFLALRRQDGLAGTFGSLSAARQVYRDPALRITGGARLRVSIRR
ncbi:MAG: hypothetical protein QOG15_1504 [Solirubrobacteraceae bacterium]|nr:hypothetical protein [Solirubrobacteraceae bacterium]